MTRKRITFVLAAAFTLICVGCGRGGSGTADESEKAADLDILNTALSQELTAVDAYTRGLPLLHGEAGTTGRRFLRQEQEHADGITKAIRGLGGKIEVDQNPLDYSGLRNQADSLSLAYGEENALIAFYLNAIPKLGTAMPKTLLTTIVANEAQHLVVLRQALGARPVDLVPDAFETGETPAPGG